MSVGPLFPSSLVSFVTTQQFGEESVAAWEYRRAFVLPDELVSVDLTGDQLVRSIKSVEAETPPEWRAARMKLSADDRGRAWFDLLLKRPAAVAWRTTASTDESLPMRRAA